jgi:hypothetical protein
MGAESLPHADKMPPLAMAAEAEVNRMMKSRLEGLFMVMCHGSVKTWTLQLQCDETMTIKATGKNDESSPFFRARIPSHQDPQKKTHPLEPTLGYVLGFLCLCVANIS